MVDASRFTNRVDEPQLRMILFCWSFFREEELTTWFVELPVGLIVCGPSFSELPYSSQGTDNSVGYVINVQKVQCCPTQMWKLSWQTLIIFSCLQPWTRSVSETNLFCHCMTSISYLVLVITLQIVLSLQRELFIYTLRPLMICQLASKEVPRIHIKMCLVDLGAVPFTRKMDRN